MVALAPRTYQNASRCHALAAVNCNRCDDTTLCSDQRTADDQILRSGLLLKRLRVLCDLLIDEFSFPINNGAAAPRD